MKTALRILVSLVFYLILFCAVLPAQKQWSGDIQKTKTRALCNDGTVDFTCKKHKGVQRWLKPDEVIPPPQPPVKDKGNYTPNPPVSKAKKDTLSKRKKEG